MTKPKQGSPTYEVPTEWRRIVMEESEDGQLRPVAVEDAPIGSNTSRNLKDSGALVPQVPKDMPEEWHDILRHSSPKGDGISLQLDAQDPAEHTIPGMQIPQLYDDEMLSLDTSSGYSIAGHEFSTPERTTVGVAPPPDDYAEFPFSAQPEPARRQAARNSPLIVPEPKPDAFPPPPSVLGDSGVVPVVQHLVENVGPTEPSLEPADPHASPLHEEVPLSTVEMDVPEESTAEKGPPTAPEQSFSEHHVSEELLDVSDLEPYDDDDEDDTGSFSSVPAREPAPNPTIESSPEPSLLSGSFEGNGQAEASSSHEQVAAVPNKGSNGISSHSQFNGQLEEMAQVQRQLLKQFETFNEHFTLQHEAQNQTQQQLDHLLEFSERQSEKNEEERRSLHSLIEGLTAEREELQFQALFGVFHDLLLLYDFVDLRLRSLWEQHGKDQPITLEMMAIRERLIELLQRQELHPIEITDPQFDPSSQRALQEVLTSEHQEDGHISRIFRQGFRYKNRVFRPSEVEVKRYPS